MKRITLLLLTLAFALSASAQILPIGNLNVTFAPDPPCEGMPVQFQAVPDNPAPSQVYYWSFGDGTNAYSAPASVSHTYTTAGTYNLWVCVSDTLNWDSACASVTINVQAAGNCITPDTIRGMVYHDVNANGTFDAWDYPIQNQAVTIDDGSNALTFFSNANGEYEFLTPTTGNYDVSIDATAFSALTPASGMHSFTATGAGQNFTGDFGMEVTNPIQDVSVSINNTFFRPGFDARSWVSFQNAGNMVVSGTVDFVHDGQLTHLSSIPNVTTYDAATQTVSLGYSNLQPGEIRYIRSDFSIPASVPLGTPITSMANIDPVSGDANPADNSLTQVDTVRGSYDPNDKRVSPGVGVTGDVLPGEVLTYTVRFQNTGTDTAFTVRIEDVIDMNLDLNTFQPLASSHPMSVEINENREVTFLFENILLPDSNTNEAESHGFVQFRIAQVAGLTNGDEIENTAAIFFDFNTPIITNTTLTTINTATSIDEELQVEGLNVFPNPTASQVRVQFENPNRIQHEIEILDMQGRTLKMVQTRGNEVELELGDYPAGSYFYHVKSEAGKRSAGILVLSK